MSNYSCSLYFEFHDQALIESLLSKGLNHLGFKPKISYIYVNEFNILDDVRFDKSAVLNSSSDRPITIQVKNKLYDDTDDYYWLKFKMDYTYNIVSLTWHNRDLKFLLKNDEVLKFLLIPNFICGYCYNVEDVYSQSNTDIDYFIQHYPAERFRTTKDYIGDPVVDISEHWGRALNACALRFMAAPLMWFGKDFNQIVSLESLQKFKYSSTDKGINLVKVNLFDIYDDPTIEDNRNKQKEFWQTFKLDKAVKNFELKMEKLKGII